MIKKAPLVCDMTASNLISHDSKCVVKFSNDVRCFQVFNSTTQNAASAEMSGTDSPVSPSTYETVSILH